MGHTADAVGPENVWVYIEEMLGELAEMASAHGGHSLATLITLAALEAARTGGGTPGRD